MSCEPQLRRHRQHAALYFRHDVRWGFGVEQEGNEPCSEKWCSQRSCRRQACSFARQKDWVVLFGSPIPSPEHARNRGGQRGEALSEENTAFQLAHSSVASTPTRTQCVFSRTFACASRSSLVSAPSTPASFRLKPMSACFGPSRRRCASRLRNAASQAPRRYAHGSACATSLASVAQSVACEVLTPLP